MATRERTETIFGEPTLTSGFGVTIGPSKILGSDLVQLRRRDQVRPTWPQDSVIVLANGDRFAGKILSGDARSISVAHKLLSKIRIPLTAVAYIGTVRIAGTPPDPLAADWLGDRKADTIRQRNGDVLRGSVVAIATDGSSVDFKEQGRASRTIPMSNVSAMGFATGLSRVRTPSGRYGHLVLTDGSRLTVSEAKTVSDSIDVTAAAGFTARFATRELIALTVRGGPAVFLADLKPIVNESKPFLDERWPTQFNRSAKGNPLLIGDDHADFGIGMHGSSTLTYALDQSYRRFDATVSLNGLTGRQGRLMFTVAVDESRQSVELNTESKPLVISRDITGRSRLTIAISVGPVGDRSADLDLADAWLVK